MSTESYGRKRRRFSRRHRTRVFIVLFVGSLLGLVGFLMYILGSAKFTF